jgi:hypothetical protein
MIPIAVAAATIVGTVTTISIIYGRRGCAILSCRRTVHGPLILLGMKRFIGRDLPQCTDDAIPLCSRVCTVSTASTASTV